jgi:hypothetical protein
MILRFTHGRSFAEMKLRARSLLVWINRSQRNLVGRKK